MRVMLKPGGKALVVAAILLIGGVSLAKFKKPSTAALAAGNRLPGSSVIDPNAAHWTLATQKPAVATMKMINDADVPSGDPHALHMEVTSVDPVKYWAAQLIKSVPDEVHADRSMTVRFWGRSKTSTPVYIVFEEGQPPHAAELSKVVKLTPDWKEYSLPFRTTKDHVDIHANFCIKAGIAAGEFDISQMRVNDLGAAGGS